MVEETVARAPRRTEAGKPRPGRVRGRRLRGGLLRLARSRPVGFASGLVLLLPSTAVTVGDYPWESWLTDGLGLVGLATGSALILVALGGRRPDWIDPARESAP